jgi:hypothetical protein
MSVVLDRRTRNGMMEELADSLTRNGAQLITWEKFADETVVPKKRKSDGEVVKKTIPEAALIAIEAHYKFEFITHMSDDVDKLLQYAKPQMMNAFHNLNVLALYQDFDEAMMRGREDTARLNAGLNLLHQRHGSKISNAIDKCKVLGGVYSGSNYFIEANGKGSEICRIITGESDPFHIPPQTDTEIAKRLQCSLQSVGSKEEKVQVVSDAIKTLILTKYKEWIEISPKMHRTRSLPSDEAPLSFIKALKILNDVLLILMGACYKSVRKIQRMTRFSVYTLVESELFPREEQIHYDDDYDHDERIENDLQNQTTPMVAAWATRAMPELTEGDLIEYDDGIVQPGAAYKRRQGHTGYHSALRRIEKSDIAPEAASNGPGAAKLPRF